MADVTTGLPTLGLNAANAQADQQYARAVAPGPGAIAAARGLTPAGFPVAQAGQGGTAAGLFQQALNSNGAQQGIPQPQPVNPRMMGTPDPTAGFPSFTNGTGSPAAFSTAPTQQPAANLAAAAPVGTNATRMITPTADSGPILAPQFAGTGPVTSAMFANPATAGGQATDAPAANLSGGGMTPAFHDPSGAISNGFAQQQQSAQDYISQALNYIQGGGSIFERATRGRAIANIMHAVVGPNDQGQVEGQGADALNQSLAGVSSAAIGANASMYGSDNALTANAQRLTSAQNEVQYNMINTPHVSGQRIVAGPGGIPMAVNTYSLSQPSGTPAAPGSAMPTLKALDNKPEQPKVIGATYYDAKGKAAVLQQDGSYKPVGQ